MSGIVAFRLESGEEVYLEAVEEPEDGGELLEAGVEAGVTEEVVRKASETLEAALSKVKPAARAVVEAFRELNEPDEIGLEFGIQFKTSVEAFVLSGEANAAFKLSLKWKNHKA